MNSAQVRAAAEEIKEHGFLSDDTLSRMNACDIVQAATLATEEAE